MYNIYIYIHNMGLLMQATGYLWPKDGLAVCGVKPSSVWNRIFRFILSCSNPQKGTHTQSTIIVGCCFSMLLRCYINLVCF